MKNLISTLLIVLFALVPQLTKAQCAMCKANAEAAQNVDAAGINSGIFILLLTPYAMLLIIGYFFWRAKKKQQEALSNIA